MQESSSHISQILLQSVNESMCKRVQLLCISGCLHALRPLTILAVQS